MCYRYWACTTVPICPLPPPHLYLQGPRGRIGTAMYRQGAHEKNLVTDAEVAAGHILVGTRDVPQWCAYVLTFWKHESLQNKHPFLPLNVDANFCDFKNKSSLT